MGKQYNDYYTYAFLREDKTPYYIGKGRGKRIYSKSRSIKAPKDKSLILYLKKNLTEAEAFKHEIYMIFVFGRKDLGTGILRNRTNGGEGTSGATRSDETRKKISEAMKNISEETRRKLSEAMSGKTHTEESKKKMSEAHKNPSEETRRKMSEANKGHIVSEETRINISEAMKGMKWWNDGCGNCKRMVECPGDGWKLGRK